MIPIPPSITARRVIAGAYGASADSAFSRNSSATVRSKRSSVKKSMSAVATRAVSGGQPVELIPSECHCSSTSVITSTAALSRHRRGIVFAYSAPATAPIPTCAQMTKIKSVHRGGVPERFKERTVINIVLVNPVRSLMSNTAAMATTLATTPQIVPRAIRPEALIFVAAQSAGSSR